MKKIIILILFIYSVSVCAQEQPERMTIRVDNITQTDLFYDVELSIFGEFTEMNNRSPGLLFFGKSTENGLLYLLPAEQDFEPQSFVFIDIEELIRNDRKKFIRLNTNNEIQQINQMKAINKSYEILFSVLVVGEPKLLLKMRFAIDGEFKSIFDILNILHEYGYRPLTFYEQVLKSSRSQEFK